MMADTPQEESVPTTDTEAVDLVSKMMEPEEPTIEEDPEETPEGEEVEAEAETEPSSEDSEEVEPETVELPDTLDGLAEELGVAPEDLAEHLKMTVVVNGESREVTLAEAKTGQQLDQDYRQKTMELADKRKAHDAEHQQVLERWQQRVARLDEAITLSEGMFAEPDREEMNRLLEEDPWQYQKVKAYHDERRQGLEKLKAERQNARDEQVKEVQKAQTEFRAEQQKLLAEKFPDVRDPEKLRMFETSAQEYLKRNGYSEEEVSQAFTLFDHRNILMLRDAMNYNAMKKGTKELTKKVKALPKVQKPGSTNTKSDPLTASRDRLLRLKKTGTKQQQTDAAVELVRARLG